MMAKSWQCWAEDADGCVFRGRSLNSLSDSQVQGPDDSVESLGSPPKGRGLVAFRSAQMRLDYLLLARSASPGSSARPHTLFRVVSHLHLSQDSSLRSVTPHPLSAPLAETSPRIGGHFLHIWWKPRHHSVGTGIVHGIIMPSCRQQSSR